MDLNTLLARWPFDKPFPPNHPLSCQHERDEHHLFLRIDALERQKPKYFFLLLSFHVTYDINEPGRLFRS